MDSENQRINEISSLNDKRLINSKDKDDMVSKSEEMEPIKRSMIEDNKPKANNKNSL